MATATPKPLADVLDQFESEVDSLESIFCTRRGRRSVRAHGYDYVPIEDGCLVSLWDAWHRFVRTLVLTCAAGPVLGLSGTLYRPAIERTEAQALADMASNKKGNNFGIVNGEPKWGGLPNLPDILNFLGLSNAGVILGAVTASHVQLGPISAPNPLEEVRKCRNYVAHKSPPTLADVTTYTRGPFVDLSTHLRQMRSGVEAFSEWRDCFVTIAGSAAQ